MALVATQHTNALTNLWDAVLTDRLGNITDKVRKYLLKNASAQVIIVTGPGGVGKSSLIESITGKDVYVGSTLHSGTRDCKLIPTIIEGHKFLFLDVPGFNTIDFEDLEVFRRLITCMTAISPFVTFIGVLFLEDLRDTRITPAAVRILKWLFAFCGPQFIPNITFVTTRWDGNDQEGLDDRRSRLRHWEEEKEEGDRGLLSQFLSSGAQWYHHGLCKDENGEWRTLSIKKETRARAVAARSMIAARYLDLAVAPLHILQELDLGMPLQDTAAARLLVGHQSVAKNVFRGANDASFANSAAPPDQEQQNSDSDTDSSYPVFEGESDQAEPNRGSWWPPAPSWKELKPWVELLFKAAQFYWGNRGHSYFPEDSGFSMPEGSDEGWGYFEETERDQWTRDSTNIFDIFGEDDDGSGAEDVSSLGWWDWMTSFFS